MLSSEELAALACAVVSTAETLGQTLSANAARLIAEDLSDYPAMAIKGALQACRRELTGKLTLAAILQRVQAADGRPEPNEAWAIALAAADEYDTVVLTDEIQKAMAVSSCVLEAGDKVGARMAFLSAYQRMVDAARAEKKHVHWNLSLGIDPTRRVEAVECAVRLGQLTQEAGRLHVAQLGHEPITRDGAAIAGLLTGRQVAEPSPKIREKLKEIREGLKAGSEARRKQRQKDSEQRFADHAERLEAHMGAVAKAGNKS